MSILDNALQLGTVNIAVGVVTAILLFKVFFKDFSDLLESIKYYAGLSSLNRREGVMDTSLFLWLGLSVAMMFASAAFLDPYPKKIEFQGEVLGHREDNNDSLNPDFDVLSYRNFDNTKVLTIALPGDSDVSIEDFRKTYTANFTSQGLKIKNRGSRAIGLKGDTHLYMSEPYTFNALLMYTELQPGSERPSFKNSSDTFVALESFEL